MRFVWKYLKPNFIGLLISTLLSTLSALGIILIMRNFHQAVKHGIDEPLLFAGIVAFGLFCFIAFGSIADRILFKRMSKVIMHMRIDFCSMIFQSAYEQVEDKKEKLFASLVTDINNISRIIEKLPIANRNFIIAFGGIIYLVTISWELSILLTAFIALTYLSMLIRQRTAYQLDRKSRKSWDTVYHHFHDTIFGIKELSLSSGFKKSFFDLHLTKSVEMEANNKANFRFFNHTTTRISESIMIISIGLMIALSLVFDFVSVSAFGEFLAIALFIINPLSSFAQFVKDSLQLKVLSDHIREIGIKLERSNEILISKETINQSNQPISLHQVAYSYKNEEGDHRFHLGPISLEVPANQITLIYGSNGSGKSTLSKILAGLYCADEGFLNYGSETVRSTNLQSYRDKVSAVFTDNHLFRTHSITEIDKERLKELLGIFEIADKVTLQDNQISSLGLSSGQSKRLALVLSMLNDKEVYIFDEWAANQDPQFKKAFYQQLIPQLKSDGKTIILITHDDQYFDIADNLIHMTEGKISSPVAG